MLNLNQRQRSRPTLLGALADPWMGPVHAALFVGVLFHWTWSWLVLWIVGGLTVPLLFGVGGVLVSNQRLRAIRQFLNDDRYEVIGVPVTSLAIFRWPQIHHILKIDAGRILVFVCRGKTRALRLTFTSRCIIGEVDFPSVILLPEVPQTPQATFELLHEIGHATNPALRAEIYLRMDPVFVVLVAGIAFTLVGPTVAFVGWCLLWLSTRYFYWLTVRFTGIESELIADAFAYEVAKTYDQSLAAARPFVRAWARVGASTGEFRRQVQSRARLRHWNGYQQQGANLPVGAVQYSFVGMSATLGLVTGAFFAQDNVWLAVVACLVVSAACTLFTFLLLSNSRKEELVLMSKLIERSKS